MFYADWAGPMATRCLDRGDIDFHGFTSVEIFNGPRTLQLLEEEWSTLEKLM